MAQEVGRGGVHTVSSIIQTIKANFTRPADTTQYASGDAISDSTSAPTVLTFANVGRIDSAVVGMGGLIIDALLMSSANQSTKGLFELFLFNVIVTAMEDNAAFDPTDAELRTLACAVIPFSVATVGNAASGASGNCVYEADNKDVPFQCATSDRDLYGVLVARNTYTPVSAERFDIHLLVQPG